MIYDKKRDYKLKTDSEQESQRWVTEISSKITYQSPKKKK